MCVQHHFCHCLPIWSISVLQMRGPSSSFTWAPCSLGGARGRGRFSHFEVSKCTEPVFPVSFQINGHHQTGGETARAFPSHAAPATATPNPRGQHCHPWAPAPGAAQQHPACRPTRVSSCSSRMPLVPLKRGRQQDRPFFPSRPGSPKPTGIKVFARKENPQWE